jgi:nucleoside-diphosphate-sugar epimerase
VNENPKFRTIVVTGASGYIGSALVRRIKRDGSGVLRLVTHSDSSGITSSEGVSVFVVNDFSDASQWNRVLSGADVVIHLAGRAHVLNESTAEAYFKYYESNVRATTVLCESAAKSGVARFVFVSSIGVNGSHTTVNDPFTEFSAENPHNAYSLSKWEAEKALVQFASKGRMELVIVRPPLVYGANAPGNFGLLKRIVSKGWYLPFGSIDNRRSLIAIDNLVDFLVTCMTHPGAANQKFLVSDGVDISTSDLLRGMAKSAGLPSRLFSVPLALLIVVGRLLRRAHAIQSLCGNLQIDSSKANRFLGWRPLITPEEGLRRAMSNNLENE